MGSSSQAVRLMRLPLRPFLQAQPLVLRTSAHRLISSDEKPLPKKDTAGPGPNMDSLPHVSEEAAEINKVKGETSPEIDQGTPVQEILKRDPPAKENTPEVLKDKSKTSTPSGTRSFSTSTRVRLELQKEQGKNEDLGISYDPNADFTVASGLKERQISKGDEGHKFGLPILPIDKFDHLHYRYEPIVNQVTKLLMKDGKLARAQTNMLRILNHLRTSPPPKPINPKPLIPGAPPMSHLPLNPVLYLTLAIDSVAPLLRMRALRGMAGGGRALPLAEPLAIRQRRRAAVMWILGNIERKDVGSSGKGVFARKFADELISIMEGRSALWDKRDQLHKQATVNRANINKVKQMAAMKFK